MKVVLYEWCCSGGMQGADVARMLPDAAAAAAHPAGPSPGVMGEGMAMFTALARDAARDADLEVTLLVDERSPPGLRDRLAAQHAAARICRVPPGEELDALADAASCADWTLVVAPETGGLLASRVAAVRRAGGRPAACGLRFIDLAGDKQATAAALAAAGVPVPAGRSLVAGEPLPEGFHLPAVCKPRDGVGCDGLAVVRTRAQAGMAPVQRRIEAFVPGIPVGVSCLCGPAGIRPLPPVTQRFSAGEHPSYRGGTVVDAVAWRQRAERLAVRAIAAVSQASRGEAAGAAACGWVGVDMILGAGEDGGGDRVLEVNPRLTTSFVGLTAALEPRSLVRLLLDTAAGRTPEIPSSCGRAIEFDATGMPGIRDV